MMNLQGERKCEEGRVVKADRESEKKDENYEIK